MLTQKQRDVFSKRLAAVRRIVDGLQTELIDSELDQTDLDDFDLASRVSAAQAELRLLLEELVKPGARTSAVDGELRC